MTSLHTKSDGFITPSGLEQLQHYKYVSGGYTKLDLLINPFWQWTVSLVPLWVAPNLLTLIGWLCVLASYLIMLFYSPNLKGDIPSWCFFLTAFCIFAYSTLDAIDGKQARRTKSSSALGQLFDHGCDSFSTTFFILGLSQAGKLGELEVVCLLTSVQLMFWTSNWIENHTGILNTKLGQLGVTEMQYFCALLHIITGIMGQNFWQVTLGEAAPFLAEVLPSSISSLPLCSTMAFSFSALLYSLFIFAFCRTCLALSDKLSGLFQFSSLFIIIGIQFLWIDLSFYSKYEGLALLNFGVLISLLVSKMIISSVMKMKLQYFHNEVMIFLLASTMMLFLQLTGYYEAQIVVFWICFIFNFATIASFLYNVTTQLAEHLGIYCFSLQKREKLLK